MANTEQADLIDRYLAAYNAFDVEGMLAVLSPEVRFENYTGGVLTAAATGTEEFRLMANQSKAIFAEREQRIVSLEPKGETVLATIAWSGKLASDIPDGPPAGTLLELQGTSEFTFKGGRIDRIVDRS